MVTFIYYTHTTYIHSGLFALRMYRRYLRIVQIFRSFILKALNMVQHATVDKAVFSVVRAEQR
jgi:hypothetical protein